MTDRIESVVERVGLEPAKCERAAVSRADVVLDLRVERIGVVQDVDGEVVWLRPRSGGKEWEARAEDVRKGSCR